MADRSWLVDPYPPTGGDLAYLLLVKSSDAPGGSELRLILERWRDREGDQVIKRRIEAILNGEVV